MYSDKETELREGKKQEEEIANKYILPVLQFIYGKVELALTAEHANFDREIIINGQPSGFLEIKARSFASTAFTTTILPIEKYNEQQANPNSLYFYAVKWTDVVGLLDIGTHEPVRFDYLKRDDRSEPARQYAFYNVKDFSLFTI